MTTKKLTPDHNPASARSQSVPPKAQNSAMFDQQLPPTAPQLRAGSLAPGQALQLQRLVGNRAVKRLLAEMGQGQPTQTNTPGNTADRTAAQRSSPIRTDLIQAKFGDFEDKEDKYTVEEFKFRAEPVKRERVKKVQFRQGHWGADKPPAPEPLSALDAAGESDLNRDLTDDKNMVGWHRGHVAAYSLGGYNIEQNIVPMKPGFNRGGDWRLFEKEKVGSGKLYTVDLEYKGSDPRIPTDINIKAEGSADTEKFDTSLIPVTGLSAAEKNKFKPGALAKVKGKHGDLPKPHLLTDASGGPAGSPRGYPDSPADRFYQELDMLHFQGNLNGDETTLGPNRDFSEYQKQMILKTNKARNGGDIKSDDPNDLPARGGVLSEEGTYDYPEIDHIVPKSRGGGNFYSNARVVSWLLNNRQDRVKSLETLIHPKRWSPPTYQSFGTDEAKKTAILYAIYNTEGADWPTSDAVWTYMQNNLGAYNGVSKIKAPEEKAEYERIRDLLIGEGKVQNVGGVLKGLIAATKKDE